MRQKYLMMQLIHDASDALGHTRRGLTKGKTVKFHKIERKGEVPFAHITYFEPKWNALFAMEEIKEYDTVVTAIHLFNREKIEKINFYIGVRDEFDVVEMGNIFEMSMEELHEKHRGTVTGKKFGI